MPIYTYRCRQCERMDDVWQSLSAYIQAPNVPSCHGVMERQLCAPAALIANDRQYDGMRASDGTDISSRTKHRNYMKSRGLTTVDDYKETWKKAAEERAHSYLATKVDKDLKGTLAQEVYTRMNQD